MKLEPGDFVEIAGVISILRPNGKLGLTMFGNAQAAIVAERQNGFWEVKLWNGLMTPETPAVIHHTAVESIVGKVMDVEFKVIPDETWREMQERGENPINFV